MTTQLQVRGEERSAVPQAQQRRERRSLALAALGWISGCFLVLAWNYVPRLANNMWSDAEFSGWVAAIAHRLHLGERMYEDVILPIPPGSMWLLAQVEAFTGRPLMLAEAWACAICHLGLALAAYAMVVPFAGRKIGLLVAGATVAFVIQLPKELLYDHTAQLVSWASFVLLARGLVGWTTPRRIPWLVGSGVLAGLACAFKQSTSVGVIGGGLVGVAYLAFVAHRRGEARSLRDGAMALAAFGLASLLGLGLTLGFVAAIGGSISGFLETVFTDGSALKGGYEVLLPRMLGYTTTAPSLPLPLLFVLGGALLAFRVVRREGSLANPCPDDEARSTFFSKRELALVLGLTTLAFLGAAVLLASRIDPGKAFVPGKIAALLARHLPSLGVALGLVFLAASFPLERRPLSRNDALAALLAAAVVAAIGHNSSVREARFFYDNNVLVAVGLLCLFLAIEKARLPWLRYLAYGVLVFSVFGGKMGRYIAARTPAPSDSFWAGMYVSEDGEKILEAAKRVRELAGPDETVLVLPEDVSFAALVGRPRPKLCGAILFVDQYPGRCLAEDLRELEANPPKVIVVYPGDEIEWRRMYALWSSRSPSGFLNNAVLRHHLPARYRHDSTFPSFFWGARTTVEIYVRNDAVERRSD